MKSTYRLKTNPQGQKILIVKGIVPVDQVEKLDADNFDMIYVEETEQNRES